MLAYSCRRKHVPSKTSETSSLPVKNDSVIIRRKIFKPRQKDIIPNAIIVNDKVARKSVDGRLYYDLLGHRYWKNYKNGKYYLFNKSMYSNDAFKIPDK